MPSRLRLHTRMDTVHWPDARDDSSLCGGYGDRRRGCSAPPRLQSRFCRAILPARRHLAAAHHEATCVLSVSPAHPAGGGGSARPPRRSALVGLAHLSCACFFLNKMKTTSLHRVLAVGRSFSFGRLNFGALCAMVLYVRYSPEPCARTS